MIDVEVQDGRVGGKEKKCCGVEEGKTWGPVLENRR